jgi:23S rRNA (adenine2030-N6)-methyltransferase
MLSYRHAFHAGNSADVLKHTVLMYCLDYLGQKEKPFLALDTHAGAGRYSLTQGYGAQNQEWRHGIQRLLDQDPLPPPLALYASLVKESLHSTGLYPGSPALIQKRIRRQDRAVCFELHPTDFAALGEAFSADSRFRLLREDGLGGLKALLPPPSRRGCVFTDPSYEIKTDYAVLPERMGEAIRRFPTGLYIIWYPLLRTGPGAALRDTLLGLYPGNRCSAELRIALPKTAPEGGGDSAGRMYGSGLVVYNPPWTLRPVLEESMPVLASLLGGETGSWDIWWEE